MMNKDKKLSGMIAVVIIIISFICAVNIQPIVFGDTSGPTELMTFDTYEQLIEFLRNSRNSSYSHGGYSYDQSNGNFLNTFGSGASKAAVPLSVEESDSSWSIDYSKTNIQVEGVDEPDMVKTDGKYLYIVADYMLFIVLTYPAEDATVLAKVTLDDNLYISNIFVNGDKLVIFANSYRQPVFYDLEESGKSEDMDISSCMVWSGTITTTIVQIYDISDRENPELVKDIEIDGSYLDSRMIDNKIYVITRESLWDIYYVYDENETFNIPQTTVNDDVHRISADEIYYVNNSTAINMMTYIVSIDLDANNVKQKSFFLGSSQEIYVSKHNIFLTYQEYEYLPPASLIGRHFTESLEFTVIHKISIDNGEITYAAEGKVPGRILNQFSMDEHNNYFRIATTVGHVWDNEHKSSNNVYILDENLERVSELENIALGERIYSARFMGDKTYLVTFKKVDPFFTLDLSDPNNPKILGKLKIPGYSDYLHPFDENHIIGIGKDTVEPQEDETWSRDFAWYQGIKIALFDISDFENPKELDKIVIGDRGTSSEALHNHKAFLFDRARELLVIPISLCEISDEIKEKNNGYTGSISGDFTFQGAYVYKLNLDGFEFKGRITHLDEDDLLKTSYWGYYGSKAVHRSLYIDDVLYTISNSIVKMNNLDDLSEINTVELN